MPIKRAKDLTNARVAIIHDWLNSFRGGERVLEAICELFPNAEIFTLFYRPGKVGSVISKHKIHTSFLNRLPKNHRYYRYLLPLFPAAIERFDLTDFDLVISSSHCVAKGVLVPPRSLHICYCYTPMRYAWDRYADYFGGGLKELLIFPFIHYLRMWDVTSSARVDRFIADSRWAGKRIEKYYRRDSQVVYPFVDLEAFKPSSDDKREDYYLAASAFAPYKRLDLAIEACNKLDRPLYIVGTGQDEARLKSLAGKQTRFLGRITDDEFRRVFSKARALLFPGEEDFGITPLEAMACGTPVIAFGRGGATETVVDGETGLFFDEQTVDSLCGAISEFERRAKDFDPRRCRARAELFRRDEFQRQFRGVVTELWNARGN